MSEYDIIVVGAGAAGLAAACTAAALKKTVLLLEATPFVGGTTAVSGGMMWVPGNSKARNEGFDDNRAEVERYLSHFIDVTDDRLQAYLTHGDEALAFLEKHTSFRTGLVKVYPDYRPEFEGSTAGGRVLEPVDYNGAELGEDFRTLRPPLPEMTLFGGMMISRKDFPVLRKADRSLKAALYTARMIAAYAIDRIKWHRGTKLVLGNALVARLYKSARDLGVEIATGSTVTALVTDNGRVTGVRLAQNGRVIDARRAVILATGGISHCDELRGRYVPGNAGQVSATVASGASKCGARLAQEIGAKLSRPASTIEEAMAFWVPVSIKRRQDGSDSIFPHTVSDRGKPGLIAVNQQGVRFTNEATSYHEFVRAQLRPENNAVPAWLVCDSHFLWRYGLGSVRPFSISHKADERQGYLLRSQTIEGLASRIGVPPVKLVETVSEFNRGAKSGMDPAFHRGESIYQRHMGDVDNKPNPCVAPIEKAPFYAVAIRPADLGIAAGIVTDQKARAISEDGSTICGLYAVGNDMESIMKGSYPGPGITIGPAIVFGFLAASDACSDETVVREIWP